MVIVVLVLGAAGSFRSSWMLKDGCGYGSVFRAGGGAFARRRGWVFQVELDVEGRLRIRLVLARGERAFAEQQPQQRAVDEGAANLPADLDVAGAQRRRVTFADLVKQLQGRVHVNVNVGGAAHGAELVESDQLLRRVAFRPRVNRQSEGRIRPPENVRVRHSWASLPKEHHDLDEIDAEGRAHGHGDAGDAAYLVVARGRHVEVVAFEHLVRHHVGEETVDRAFQSLAHAVVIEQSDVRLGGGADAELGKVHDAARGDLLESAGGGGGGPDDAVPAPEFGGAPGSVPSFFAAASFTLMPGMT